MTLPLRPYKPGEQLQADTVNRLLRNSGGPSAQNGIFGDGMNFIIPSPLNEQSMADLTDSDVGTVKSHSVIYCKPTESAHKWSTVRRRGSQPFYTLGNSSIDVVGSQKTDITGAPYSPPQITGKGERKMIACEALIPGKKYVLRAQPGFMAEGQLCEWDGERLIASSNELKAEFIVLRHQVTGPPEAPVLNAMNADPLFNPLRLEGYGPIRGKVEIGFEMSPHPADPRLGDQQGFYLDNVWPRPPGVDINGNISGIGSMVDPIIPDDLPGTSGYVEALYKPVPDTDLEGGEALVVLPISPQLSFADVNPRPNGYTKSRGTSSDADKLGFLQHDVLDATQIAASYLGAKSMGLIEPVLGDLGLPQCAYYSGADKVPIETFAMIKKGDAAPTKVPQEYLDGRHHNIETGWVWTQLFSFKSSTDEEYVVYEGGGKYTPHTTGVQMFLDPFTKTKPAYMRRVRVDALGNTPGIHQLIDGSEEPSTCGWLKFEYDWGSGAGGSSPQVEKEIIKLPRPNPAIIGVFKEADASTGEATFEYEDGGSIKTYKRNPQQPINGDTNYGMYDLVSCDPQTGECTWEFTPKYIEYDQINSFPFWPGITSVNRMMVTSKPRLAHKETKQWIPAFCKESDRNEILIPGERIQYEMKAIELLYYVHRDFIKDPDDPTKTWYEYPVDFVYAEVTPPERYLTDIEGTPHIKFVDIARRRPTNDEIDVQKIITEDDFWITKRAYIKELPNLREPNHIYYAAMRLTEGNSKPDMREPFGAFNDCENKASIALFMKRDRFSLEYPNSVNLTFVPFGYAVPSKTPSCFYKATAQENCAPQLVGQQYRLVRDDTNFQLMLAAACYVPCSTLTTL